MSSYIAERIDQVIEGGLAQLMKAHGFSKASRTFHRRVAGHDWQVVNVQASTGNVGESGKFTVNFGVYLNAISLLAGEARSGKPKEYECTHRERIGRSMAGGQDYWWEINPSTDLKVVANEVLGAVRDLGLPWLEKHADVQRVAAVLENQPSVMSAAAALAAGDRAEAQRRIMRMATDRPMAATTARAWAREHGLDFDVA